MVKVKGSLAKPPAMAGTTRQRHYLTLMDIQVWEARGVPVRPETDQSLTPPPVRQAAPQESATSPVDGGPRQAPIAGLDWAALEERVAACTACELHRTRTQAVFGVGRRDAEWMVIGEAPGAEEDRQGEPFVGRAGQLLNAMLAAIGLKREQVYIANILKSRPPNNRDPRPEEAGACRPFLDRQIALVAPRIILAVGRIAAQNLLFSDAPIGTLRGRVHRLPASGVPVVVTYHPAYLLRSPREKRKAWDDLRLAWAVVHERDDGTAQHG